MFDYDWFHGASYEQQQQEARARCLAGQFPDLDAAADPPDPDAVRFEDELRVRALIYLRDGFSYEIREIAQVTSKSHLVFECEPVDDQYKVGAFVVTVPFEEIVRVEVYAVHPSQQPEDSPQITGFRTQPETGDHKVDGKHAPMQR